MAEAMARVGVVAIGRNEGERLVRCLASVPRGLAVVYVDSGSNDGSVAAARAAGAQVVSLDMAQPFTAARARNEGFQAMIDAEPELDFIQFVDGDCEFEPAWIATAAAVLSNSAHLGVVFGRRRERFPDASLFNALCDREWDVPAGERDACGGDSLMRVSAYQAAGGFNPAMTAHEEPELSARIRGCGFSIVCIDAPMTVHDAAIFRLGQWWRRNARAGYGYAQAFALHSRSKLNPAFALVRSALVWGLVGPLAVILAVAAVGWGGCLLLVVYPLQVLRNLWRERNFGRLARARSVLMVLSKFAETGGILLYLFDRVFGRRRNAIVYKD